MGAGGRKEGPRAGGGAERAKGPTVARPARHTLVVDRFEGEWAVVELDGRRFLDLPRTFLPPDARSDDVLVLEVRGEGGEAELRLRRDLEATRRALERGRKLVERLRKKDPGGDIVL